MDSRLAGRVRRIEPIVKPTRRGRVGAAAVITTVALVRSVSFVEASEVATVSPGTTALASTVLTATTDTAERTRNWEFTVAPYIWLPAMSGKATVNGTTLPIDTTVGDLFTQNDFVFALSAQVEAWRKRRWGMIFNGMWVVLKQDDKTADAPGPLPPFSFDLKMNSGIFEFLAAYNIGDIVNANSPTGGNWGLQPFIGARVTILKQDLDPVMAPSVDATKRWADPILGARNIVKWGEGNRWSWTLRGDFGGFGAGSDFTWQGVGMFGYDFTMFKIPSTAMLGGRALYQDYSSDGFKWDVTQYGPVLGLGLHF